MAHVNGSVHYGTQLASTDTIKYEIPNEKVFFLAID
jgi:hypothetical protein